jgi:hypothetical protein
MSDAFVASVRVIVQVLDVFLGALTKLTDAASHLPFIGDKFKGVSDKINESRGFLREFGSELDSLDGRTVSVNIAVDVTTGRREEGALGRLNTGGDDPKEVPKKIVRDLETLEVGAGEVETAAKQTTTATNSATKAVDEQRKALDRLAALHAKKQSTQFEALGLTSTGDRRVPGVQALRNRLGDIRQQIKGTLLDTEKTRDQLARIAKVLSGQFGAVGRNVRQAILQMFNEISSSIKTGSDSTDKAVAGGQITPGGIRPLQRLIAGANLTAEQIAILERNMQRRRKGRPINAFGRDFDGGTGEQARAFRGLGGNFGVPDVFVTVEIDGQKVTGVVKKQLQKTGRRRTNRRGGAGAGRGAIL